MTHDKFWGLDVLAPAETVKGLHDFHRKAGPLGTPLFPMSPSAMTIRLHSVEPGFTTHSFRRTCALGIRLKAESLGVSSRTDDDNFRIPERASRIAHWALTSRSFFDYSVEFRCWVNEPLCLSRCVLE